MAKKIKILFVMDHYYFSSGGTEGQIFNLIKNLDRNIFEPQACVFQRATDYFEKEYFPCPTFCLEIGSFFSLSTYGKFFRLRDYIRKERIDLVQTVFNDSALSFPFFTLGTKAKIVSTRRDMGFWYTPARLCILRVNALLTDKYLVNSYAVKENVQRKEYVPGKKIVVIPNGYDLSRFSMPPFERFHETYMIPQDAPVVGIVANLRPVKRVNDLISAFAHVVKEMPDSYLVIVGHTGELFDNYMTLARSLGIEDRLRFLGQINEPVPIIKRFSVGINCSESEGLSNAIIEYMGCGVPVLATNTEGNRELVVHGQTGLLVPVGDIQALASLIVRLLRDGDLRDKVVANAHDPVLRRFDEKIVMRQYERFYLDFAVRSEIGRMRGSMFSMGN